MNVIKKLVLLALLAASALVIQIGLAVIPNVELVTLWFLIIALSLSFKDSLIIIFVFSLLEALVWGFGDWVIGYLWIWNVWILIIHFFKPIFKHNESLWALLAAFYGFMFGALFALQHGLMYGVNLGMLYWVRGIPFDILHAVSNYILVLLLYTPLSKTFTRLLRKWSPS